MPGSISLVPGTVSWCEGAFPEFSWSQGTFHGWQSVLGLQAVVPLFKKEFPWCSGVFPGAREKSPGTFTGLQGVFPWCQEVFPWHPRKIDFRKYM